MLGNAVVVLNKVHGLGSLLCTFVHKQAWNWLNAKDLHVRVVQHKVPLESESKTSSDILKSRVFAGQAKVSYPYMYMCVGNRSSGTQRTCVPIKHIIQTIITLAFVCKFFVQHWPQ